MRKPKNLAGQRFGRLTALEYLFQPKASDLRSKWRCVCDCGTEISVAAASLICGDTASCGCFRHETTSARNRTHGMRNAPEYSVWHDVIRRCCDPRRPDYPHYGGRGITVCERWKDDFKAFYDDMGPRPSAKHSIERCDNSKGYAPGNCFWATKKQQARNTRSNHLITYMGATKCITEWEEHFGFKPMQLVRQITVLKRSMEAAIKYLQSTP